MRQRHLKEVWGLIRYLLCQFHQLIFGFLKSVILKTVRKKLGDVPPTFGCDLAVFEPKTKQIMSEGGSFKSLSEGMDEPLLNPNPVVEDCEDSDGDGLIQLLRSSNLNPSKQPNQTNRALSGISKPQF